METSNYTILDFALGLFVKVPEFRTHRTRVYPLPMILLCALGAFLCGGGSFHSMATFALTHQGMLTKLFGVTSCPSHDTFSRVFVLMDKQAFALCLLKLSEKFGELLSGGVIAIDGKTCRGARDITRRAAHVVSAWSPGTQMTLALIDVDEKSNEIPTVPNLIKLLGTSVAGAVVTADALNTQRATTEAIIQSQADYVLPVKENQPNLYDELKLFLDSMADREKPGYSSIDKGHGRLEVRKCWQTTQIDWLSSAGEWAGLKSICVVDRESEDLVSHEKTYMRRYFISSLPLDPQRIAQCVREHWGVENSCHWVLDVVFGEDQNRARTGNAAVNLRTLRSLAMNILSMAQKKETKQISKRNMMFRAAMDSDYLYHLLGCPSGWSRTES